jgi:hypothetical protein
MIFSLCPRMSELSKGGPTANRIRRVNAYEADDGVPDQSSLSTKKETDCEENTNRNRQLKSTVRPAHRSAMVK